MRKSLKTSLVLVIIILSVNTRAQNLSTVKKAIVQSFIECVEQCTWEELSESINYPLRRAYPIPDIENKADFLLRRTELFDDSLSNLILSSSVDSNWSEVGWRGIMLNHGVLWLDEEGKLIAINYQTEAEKSKQKELIEADRNSINENLRDYERPVLQMNVEKFDIRIDEMQDGSYRYMHWIGDTRRKDGAPDLIIYNGEINYSGSGGNHYYEFAVLEYDFRCWVQYLGKEDDPPGSLELYQYDELLLSYPAVWLKN